MWPTHRQSHPFSPDGKFVAAWKFGRPSDVVIDKNDVMYVNDAQSDEKTSPGFHRGIRIGGVKDGKVTAFIPQTDRPSGRRRVGPTTTATSMGPTWQSQGMVRVRGKLSANGKPDRLATVAVLPTVAQASGAADHAGDAEFHQGGTSKVALTQDRRTPPH